MIHIDINLLFTIINLLILYFLMKKFLIGPILSIMDKRQKMIEEGLGNARISQREAEELKAKYDENLQHAHAECEILLEDAKKRAQQESDRMIQDAQSEVQQIHAKAQEDIQREKEKTAKELQTQVAQLALAAAIKVSGEKNSQEQDLELYEQFLKKAGGAYGTDNH
ncbi:MAG: F0F1 ATP synthase subunit B [Blautia sp.]